MSDELAQEEADNLLAQHKKYIRHEPVFWPNPGAKVTVDLLSLDEREAFLLDVSRASIKLKRLVLQTSMFYLATPTVLSLFKEDVQKWLEHSDIRFVPNIQFIGKTGYIHHFDFAIPGSRAAPERIIKAIGNPNKDAALAYVTSWIDTSDQRPPSSQALAFLNDSGRTVGAPVLDALRQYDISPVLWSQRETHRQALAM